MLTWLVMRLIVLMGLAGSLLAQEPSAPVFRVDSNLATVRFNAVRGNEYIQGLKPDDIVVLENGSPQKVTFLEGGVSVRRTVPMEIILLFDTSSSVTSLRLLDPLVFKSTLLDFNPNVKVSVYAFDTNLRVYARPTRDVNDLGSAIQKLQSEAASSKQTGQEIALQLPAGRRALAGQTWLYEAIIATLRESGRGSDTSTRMMVVFSDGLGTTESEPSDVSPLAEEQGVPIYPVLLGHSELRNKIERAQERARRDANQTSSARSNNKRGNNSQLGTSSNTSQAEVEVRKLRLQEDRMAAFTTLGRLTGGRAYDPLQVDLDILRQILGSVQAAAVSEYVAGFVPEPSTGEPRKRKLEVKLVSITDGKVLGGKKTIVR